MKDRERPRRSPEETRPMKERNAVLATYLAVLAFAMVWTAGIFLAPWLRSRSSHLAAWIYAAYAPVCHQIPSRSFFLWDCPLAVCGRCLGIYAGFLCGTIIHPLFRGFRPPPLPETGIFILAAAPIGLDTLANFVHLYGSPNGLRLATGVIWGLILPVYLIGGLADVLIRRGSRSRGA